MQLITYMNTFRWLEHANLYDYSQQENYSYTPASAESGLGYVLTQETLE